MHARTGTSRTHNVTHSVWHPQGPLIFAGRLVELQFRMSRPLTDFMATLHKNGIEEKKLSKYVQHSVIDDTVTFNIRWVQHTHRHTHTRVRDNIIIIVAERSWHVREHLRVPCVC